MNERKDEMRREKKEVGGERGKGISKRRERRGKK